jgi:hypothetical protein
LYFSFHYILLFLARSDLFWRFSILRASGMGDTCCPTPLTVNGESNRKETEMTNQSAVGTAPTFNNGVNVDALFETVEAVKEAPRIADFQFRLSNRWLGGDHNRSTVVGFHGACEDHDHMKGTMRVESEADVETLEALVQFSPVYDIVSKSLPVDVRVEKA